MKDSQRPKCVLSGVLEREKEKLLVLARNSTCYGAQKSMTSWRCCDICICTEDKNSSAIKILRMGGRTQLENGS